MVYIWRITSNKMKLFNSKKAEGDTWATITSGEIIAASLVIFGLFFIASSAYSAEQMNNMYFAREVVASTNLIYALNGDARIVFSAEDPDYGVKIKQNTVEVNYFRDGNYEQSTPFYARTEFSTNNNFYSSFSDEIINVDSFVISRVGKDVSIGKPIITNTNTYGDLNKADFIPFKISNPEEIEFFELGFGQNIDKQFPSQSDNANLIILISKTNEDVTKISYSVNGKPHLHLIAEDLNSKFIEASKNLPVLKFKNLPIKTDLRIYGTNVIFIQISENLLKNDVDSKYVTLLGKLTADALFDVLKD